LTGSDLNVATGINNLGAVVGYSVVGGDRHAVEWIGSSLISLGGLPGSTQSEAYGINDLGQVVGDSLINGEYVATEWSHGEVTNLGALAGASSSAAFAINDLGQIVGWSMPAVPELSTWEMIVIAFAGVGLAARFRERRGARYTPGLKFWI
jgi:probable HAF family extracellular repeat protein